MYYEVNVSLHGQHLFATAERSTTNLYEAERLYKLFKEKFPEEEGYKLTVTKWNKVGKEIDMSYLNQKDDTQ
jgi:hypothetical protein